MARDLSWPEVFRTIPPGTRVCVPEDGFPQFAPRSLGTVLTHADDGCTLVAFDAPLCSTATKTKPADAWWCTTALMEILP